MLVPSPFLNFGTANLDGAGNFVTCKFFHSRCLRHESIVTIQLSSFNISCDYDTSQNFKTRFQMLRRFSCCILLSWSCRSNDLDDTIHGLPQHLISRLQSIQNTAARVVTRTRKFDHITPVLKQLHWLPVRYRIVFKILLYWSTKLSMEQRLSTSVNYLSTTPLNGN